MAQNNGVRTQTPDEEDNYALIEKQVDGWLAKKSWKLINNY